MASSEYGEISLTQRLPFYIVDSLVGWATHVTSEYPQANPNPLLDISANSPLRAGELQIIHNAMTEFIINEKAVDFAPLYREFDQSALVSLGICLEEMITATLLPFARAHVRRCGEIDDPETLHTELTLPPEEAILKLRPQDWQGAIKPGLPTAEPATRAEPSKATNSFFRPSPKMEAHRALQRWISAHGIDPDFFDKNRETFSVLLGPLVAPKPDTGEEASTKAVPSPSFGT